MQRYNACDSGWSSKSSLAQNFVHYLATGNGLRSCETSNTSEAALNAANIV